MTWVKCRDCGTHFERREDETWKVRCIGCFKKSKRAQSAADNYWIDRATAAESKAAALESQVEQQAETILHLVGQRMRQPAAGGLERELAENWRALVQLAHPDKHGGSAGATRVSQWLNGLKGRLPCG